MSRHLISPQSPSRSRLWGPPKERSTHARRPACATILISLLFLGMVLLSHSGSCFADPLDNWHWRNPLPQGNDLYAVVYGNGTFVAVSVDGTILTSPDGVTWTQRDSGVTRAPLYGVTYGNNTFVAVGQYYASNTYTAVILTSPDGVTWTQRNSGVSAGACCSDVRRRYFCGSGLFHSSSPPQMGGRGHSGPPG